MYQRRNIMDFKSVLGSAQNSTKKVTFWDSDQEIFLAELVEKEDGWPVIAEKQSERFGIPRSPGAVRTRYETKILPKIQAYEAKQLVKKGLEEAVNLAEEYEEYKKHIADLHRKVQNEIMDAYSSSKPLGEIVEILKQLD